MINISKKNILKKVTVWLFYTILLTGLLTFSADLLIAQEPEKEDLNVFSRWANYRHSKNLLGLHFIKQIQERMDIRREEISVLRTKEDWQRRQEQVYKTIRRLLGPFPEKTPLNPKITGVLRKEGYRVEKIIYESMPNFHVTGCLFIPDGISGKAPTILNVIGHTEISFRAESYQNLILNLVKKGFIVFAPDPIGQGERKQYFDPGNERWQSVIGRATSEHSYLGRQCFISGFSPGLYFTWDGVRAIDYLLTRKEVDPDRIGVTGISGGGNLTAYISAVDKRVKAAAPNCWITTISRLVESIGCQDAEQNVYKHVANGIDHADYLEVRAPKPTLMVTTTRDFFSIQGARESFAEAQKAFLAFDKLSDISMVEDNDVHRLTEKNNEAIYAFFQKYLNNPGYAGQEDIPFIPAEELQITKTGQTTTSLESETVFSLNKKMTEKLLKTIEYSRKDIPRHLEAVKQDAIQLSGYRAPSEVVKYIFRGRYQRDGYSVEKYIIHSEGELLIPALVMIPDNGEKFPSVIYLHPEGKAADALPGGRIEKLVKKGFLVIAPDLSGIGEMGDTRNRFVNKFEPMLIGRSVVGIRAGDVVRIVQFLKNRQDVKENEISAISFGSLSTVLLHSAVFENSINKIILVEPLLSYSSIVMNRFYEVPFSAVVPGVLQAYDLPDLAAAVAPRKLLMINIKDQMNEPAKPDVIGKEMNVVHSVYSSEDAKNNLKISVLKTNEEIDAAAYYWIQ